MRKLQIPRIVKMPVEVQAADALRESIVNGAIPSGSRVTEIGVSEQMGLSRATVRTALHQLATEGLITLVPYTGWTVVSLSDRDIWELYTLRSSVERLAGQLVARAINDSKGLTLRRAFEVLVKQCHHGDRSKIADADFSLHKTIISLADHGRLAIQYGLIEQQTRIYIRSSDALIAEASTITEQHRPIVEAILAGNEADAGQLSEAHNLMEGEKLSAHRRRQQARNELPTGPASTRQRARPGAARAKV